MDDLEYIKKFSKITIKSICEKCKVNRGNIFTGRASKKAINKVKKRIESEVASLYIIKDDSNEERESSL